MALKEQFVTTEILEMEHTKMGPNHDLKKSASSCEKKNISTDNNRYVK